MLHFHFKGIYSALELLDSALRKVGYNILEKVVALPTQMVI